MFLGFITLFVALCISACSAYYSIVGLTAIFAAAFWPIVIMGSVLEAGKVITTLWLHYNWSRADWKIKTYLSAAVCVLMLITSMGTFGYLSKAHLDQAVPSGDIQAQVQLFDDKIKTQHDNIESAKKALTQMDGAVDQILSRTTDDQGATKSANLRRSQTRERATLQHDIELAQKEITKLQEQRAPIASKYRKVEADVGPIKYIAALLYGDKADENMLEAAVRWVIIIIVLVFDPLAIVLLLAATTSIDWSKIDKKKKKAEEAKEAKAEQEVNVEQEGSYQYEDMLEKARVLAAAEYESKLEQFKLDECTKCVAFIDKDLMQAQEDLAHKAAEQAATEEELVALAEVLSQISNDYDELAPTVEQLEEECSELVNTDEELKKELESLFDDYNQVLEEKKALEDLVAELEKKIPAPVTNIAPAVLEPTDLNENATSEEIAAFEEMYLANAINAEPLFEGNIANIFVAPINATPATMPTMPVRHDVVMPKMEAVADTLPKGSNADFGTTFPTNPSKGDLYLRVDYMPNKLFKWSGVHWIEMEKSITEAYAYNEEYIQLLVERIGTGEIDIDDLSSTEQAQIQDYLTKQGTNGTSN